MVYSLHEYDAEKRGEAKGRTEGLQEGLQKGRAEGEKEGQGTILALMQKLFATGRIEDAQKASCNKEYCAKLLKEYNLA